MKKETLITGFLILLLLLLIYRVKKPYKENYKKKIQVVVSRYNEELDFLFDHRFKKYDIVCYNKGINEPKSGYPNNCTVIRLTNVGRCDHTYLYHIITNYNNLHDVTIFLPASCTMTEKVHLFNSVINEVEKTNDTVLTHRSNFDYITKLEDFYLDSYQGVNPDNVKINPEWELQLSEIRPFGKWYEHNFPELKGVSINYLCYKGIFAVSKEDIWRNPIEKYKQLISYVDNHSNPEAGHYIERSWGALFYKKSR